MEQRIAVWSTAVMLAGIVALMIYGSVIDLAEPQTIRDTAEFGAIFVAVGCAFASFI